MTVAQLIAKLEVLKAEGFKDEELAIKIENPGLSYPVQAVYAVCGARIDSRDSQIVIAAFRL